jgi:hypothetical protein
MVAPWQFACPSVGVSLADTAEHYEKLQVAVEHSTHVVAAFAREDCFLSLQNDVRGEHISTNTDNTVARGSLQLRSMSLDGFSRCQPY